MRVCVCVRVCVCASMLCELRDYYIRNKRIFGREKDAQKDQTMFISRKCYYALHV